ncbi:MAG: hypothetical protein ABIS06_06690 [Vicinamibacterales bacterium]
MRYLLSAVLSVVLVACAGRTPSPSYLFVWAGDADRKSSDFLGVIDASPHSPHYGAIVASIPIGEIGTYPHHTEQEMPANGHLLANGFGAGRTWLFDLTDPRTPKILTSFGAKAGFSNPHSFERLANGEVLATFQYGEGERAVAHDHAAMGGAPAAHSPAATPAAKIPPTTGGLVHMNERGDVIRAASARDGAIAYSYLYPYHVLPLPGIDRAVSSTTDMDDGNKPATSEWVQIWRLSDLTLLKSFALTPGPRGDEHKFTGELRLLPDGKSVYLHTFNCGLYLLRDLDLPQPRATFVTSFQGGNCGVPVISGHYWLQPVPEAHALIALDISDPEHPRQVSSVSFGNDEAPHWAAIDPTGRRVVVNSAGSKPNRLYIVDVDPASGALSLDQRFRDGGVTNPGVTLTGKSWPHGFSGTAKPHGTVFSLSRSDAR